MYGLEVITHISIAPFLILRIHVAVVVVNLVYQSNRTLEHIIRNTFLMTLESCDDGLGSGDGLC